MAKINRATRIALVTGEMKDCISAIRNSPLRRMDARLAPHHQTRPLAFDARVSRLDIPSIIHTRFS